MRRSLLSRTGAWTTIACGLGLVGLVAACEDPPPPTPAGGYTVAFSQTTGGVCGIGSHQNKMGEVLGTGDPTLITSGTQDTTTTCTIEAVSGGFSVQASLDSGATVTVSIGAISDSTTEAAPATGSISYASSQTAGDVFQSPQATPCEFWIDAEAGQYVRAGEAWITFRCAEVVNENDTCGISTSYFALRNCVGATDEES
jgi:hypothetical protein